MPRANCDPILGPHSQQHPITTTYTYDTNTGLGNGTGTGELLGLTYSDSTHPVSYTYTRFGQLKSVSDATGLAGV